MIADDEVQRRLEQWIERREARVRRGALGLIAGGLVLVYSEAAVALGAGTVLTVLGMLFLLLLVRGHFAIEHQQARVVARALEHLCYDDESLRLLWEEVVRHGALGSAGWAPSRMDLVVLQAISLLRRRRTMSERSTHPMIDDRTG